MVKNIIITILLAAVAWLGWDAAKDYYKDFADELRFSRIAGEVPQKEDIKKILQSIEYSAIPTLLNESSSLSIDFNHQTWTFHGAHRFDNKGNVILDQGKFGLCGDLTAYTKQKISPLLSNDFKISFADVSQSGFFPSTGATHTVLLIHPEGVSPQDPGTYILDPSFNRYGNFKDFEDYVFYEVTDSLRFVQNQETDETFAVNTQSPLVIRSNHIIGLMAEKVDGKFDPENFSLALTATKRLAYRGRYLYQIYASNGKVHKLEDKRLANNLNLKDYSLIKEKMNNVFANFHQPNKRSE